MILVYKKFQQTNRKNTERERAERDQITTNKQMKKIIIVRVLKIIEAFIIGVRKL